jgi:hypothetical protein
MTTPRPGPEDAAIMRRLDALERATEKRLDDARDIHRREHEAWDAAHATYHARYEASHQAIHNKADETNRVVTDMYEQRFATEGKHRDEARVAMDRRLEGMNEIRAQLNAQAATFVTIAAFAEFTKAIDARLEQIVKALDQRHEDNRKHTDERYEDNRKRIETLEKGDVKQEGKALGQGAVIAIILGAISATGVILGIIITLANVATGNGS